MGRGRKPLPEAQKRMRRSVFVTEEEWHDLVSWLASRRFERGGARGTEVALNVTPLMPPEILRVQDAVERAVERLEVEVGELEKDVAKLKKLAERGGAEW